MEYLSISNSNLSVSRLALGLMRIAGKRVAEAEKLINAAVELGINLFDHADIYGAGKSESLFGEVLKRNPLLREKMIIQSKCGIRRGFYDLSFEHIVGSVEESLKRLGIDSLDILLLHRPDTLMEPEEVNKAFSYLDNQGMVRAFGVSNMNPMQTELLQKSVEYPLLFNQLQFSLVHAGMVDSGINVNMTNSRAVDYDGNMLEYARLKNITIQAWSILQASKGEGTFLDNPNYTKLNERLAYYAEQYGVEKSAVALSWILRHPAKMVAIAGTTSPKHLEELAKGVDINLTRQEWYDLYLSAGRLLP